jgi:sugar phosphate isomerase/epimerase
MPHFRYSLNSSTIRPTPILEKIRVAADAGYEAIELWHDDIEKHLAAGGSLAEIRRAVDDRGLAVPTTIYLKGWSLPDGPEYRGAMEEVRRRLEQSAAVGAKHVVASPPPGKDVDYALTGRRYKELLDLGLSFGVRPAFEYLGFVEEVNSIAKALRVMRESGHPQATIVLDPFHDFRGGAGHEEIARLRAEQIAVSHFDDAPASPPAPQQHDPDRVMPGDGCINLKRYCALLSQVGYTGFVSLELFREDLWQRDPLEVARIGLQKMKAVCEG